MKIALTGNYGKTSIILNLAAKLMNVNYINILNLSYANLGIVSDIYKKCTTDFMRNVFISENWCLARQIQEEIDSESSNNITLCDQTILEPLGYAHLKGIPLFDYHKDFVKEWWKTYNYVFYLKNSSCSTFKYLETFIEENDLKVNYISSLKEMVDVLNL